MLAGVHRRLAAAALLVAVLLVGLAAAGWPTLRISPFKPLPQALLVEGTAIVAERTSPIGLVQVVRSERIPFRSVTGLSLMNRQEPAPQLGLFVDGEGPVPVTRFTGDWGPLAYLDATLAALPYRLLDRPRVLLLGLGGGTDLLLALRHGAARVDVVEPDGSVADLLLAASSRAFAGPILDRPEVRLHVDTARRFTAAAEAPHDLIVLHPHRGRPQHPGGELRHHGGGLHRLPAGPGARRPAGPAAPAAPAAARQPEAGADRAPGAGTARRRASRPGTWCWSGRGTASCCWSAGHPFAASELATVDAFAEALAFDLGWHPGMAREAADRFNLLGEPVLFDGVAALTGPDRSAFVAGYAFDIRPATDDRPYFLDFFRWRALPALWAAARQGNAGLLDWGWPLQLATLGVAVLSGLVLILLPARLLAGRADRRLRRATAAYFLLIGLGFLLVEIAVLQRLVLLLGHPVHAFAVTLATFLVCAGIGSGVAARLEGTRSGAGRTMARPAGAGDGADRRAGDRCTPWPGRGCSRGAWNSPRSRVRPWPSPWSHRSPSPWACRSRWPWRACGRPRRRWCRGPGA